MTELTPPSLTSSRTVSNPNAALTPMQMYVFEGKHTISICGLTLNSWITKCKRALEVDTILLEHLPFVSY